MAANHFGGRSYQQPHHAGQKRQADDELDNQSNISSRLKKLRLSNVLPSSQLPLGAEPTPPIPQAQPPPPTLPSTDFMPIDDTPHRIIIHDLDAELREIEASEPSAQFSSTLFPADIDKKVSALPSYLLQSKSGNSNTNPNTQLILYREPQSISVPESEDAVRKAVIAARKRMREKQAKELGRGKVDVEARPALKKGTGHVDEINPWVNGHYYGPELSAGMVNDGRGPSPSHYYMENEDDDPDAMDIG